MASDADARVPDAADLNAADPEPLAPDAGVPDRAAPEPAVPQPASPGSLSDDPPTTPLSVVTQAAPPSRDRLAGTLSWLRDHSRTARPSFRLWRRTRPFWGGLLLALAGLELVLIPLSGVLGHGAVKLVIYIGIGGVFGVLIGVLLIACGVMIWVNAAHRQFYGIAGVVLGILSFPASNLGGFFIGMLLAIAGGSVAFAWTPVQPARPAAAGERLHRTLAITAMPLVLAASTLGSPAARAATAAPRETCILFICLPGPSPSPSPGPSPSGPVPGLPGPGPSPSPAPSKSPSAAQKRAAGSPGLVAAAATSVIKAGSAAMDHFAYQGVATLPTAGGTVRMMKFTAASLDLSGGVRATVSQGGRSTVTTSPELDFSGAVVLYATQLSGCLGPVCVTLTPDNAVTVLLKLIGPVTSRTSLTLRSVTTDQPLVTAGSLQAAGLNISLS